jgi:hypothetical protein
MANKFCMALFLTFVLGVSGCGNSSHESIKNQLLSDFQSESGQEVLKVSKILIENERLDEFGREDRPLNFQDALTYDFLVEGTLNDNVCKADEQVKPAYAYLEKIGGQRVVITGTLLANEQGEVMGGRGPKPRSAYASIRTGTSAGLRIYPHTDSKEPGYKDIAYLSTMDGKYSLAESGVFLCDHAEKYYLSIFDAASTKEDVVEYQRKLKPLISEWELKLENADIPIHKIQIERYIKNLKRTVSTMERRHGRS